MPYDYPASATELAVLVVDANVVVQASIDAARLGPLAGHDLVAPPIMPSEVVSSLHELKYRQEISVELASKALEVFSGLEYRLMNPPELLKSAWEVAESLGWAKTYDAEYVALARLLDCALVTLDRRLARGAGRLARILDPAEL